MYEETHVLGCALRSHSMIKMDVYCMCVQARVGKDFKEADRVRLLLASKGILIMDSPEGTTWRPGMASQ